jgi:hypothetical protein
MTGCVRFAFLVGLAIAIPRAAESQLLVSIARQANAADSAGRHREAAVLWRQGHGIAGGDPTILYLVAGSEARAGNNLAAVTALQAAVRDGLVIPDAALERDLAFQRLHTLTGWATLLAEKRLLDRGRNDTLRRELLQLAERDQANRTDIAAVVQRFGFRSSQADSADKALGAADAPLQARLRRIVAEHGWPSRRLVGDDGAHAAWLLLQHADSGFQREMIAVLRDAARRNDARTGDFALLEDRMRMNSGLLQRYGNALKSSTVPGAPPLLAPIEMEECVDARRAAMLLPPLADYLAMFGVVHVPAAQRSCRIAVSRESLLRDEPPLGGVRKR